MYGKELAEIFFLTYLRTFDTAKHVIQCTTYDEKCKKKSIRSKRRNCGYSILEINQFFSNSPPPPPPSKVV